MKQNKALQVLFDNRVVGTLALAANHKVVFQYDDSWLEQGFSISPFSLPLENQVFVPTKDYFDGLFWSASCSWNYGWNEKRTLYGYHN